MKNTSSHFDSYTSNGILIYIINKKTKLKVAIHKNLNTNAISIWDQTDKQTDVFNCGVDLLIIKHVDDDMKTYPQPNSKLLPKELKKKVTSESDGTNIPQFFSLDDVISSGHTMSLGHNTITPSFSQGQNDFIVEWDDIDRITDETLNNIFGL
jgi:hypothetical protein